MTNEVEGLDLDALEKLAEKLTDHHHLMQRDGFAALHATATQAAAALRAQAERVRVLEGELEEYGEIGERDGYERAVQDIDLLTGGDGEYRVSTQAARSCPDVATMKTRIAARFAEGQSAIERLMEQKRTTKALGCPHYGDLALRCAAAEARAEAAERRAGELAHQMGFLLHGLPEILETGGIVDEEGLIEQSWMLLTRPATEAQTALLPATQAEGEKP